jgi:hypothetical protein
MAMIMNESRRALTDRMGSLALVVCLRDDDESADGDGQDPDKIRGAPSVRGRGRAKVFGPGGEEVDEYENLAGASFNPDEERGRRRR